MSGKLQAVLWIATMALLYTDLWLALRVLAGSIRWRRVADLPVLLVGAMAVGGIERMIPRGALSMPIPLLIGLAVGAVWCGVQVRTQARAIRNWQEVRRGREDSRQAVLHLALVTGSLVFLFPFLWLVSTSLKVEEKMFTQPPELIPRRYLSAFLEENSHKLARVEIGGKPQVVALFSTAGDRVDVRRIVPAERTIAVPSGQVDVQGDLTIPVAGSECPLALVTMPNKKLGDQKLSGVVLRDENGVSMVRLVKADPAVLSLPASSAVPIQQIYLQWQNYPKALEFLPEETGHGLIFLRNTLYLCLMNILGTVLSGSLVAYSFARLRWPGRDALFVVLLATMMLPGAVTMIPVFLIFRSLGWVDTLRPLWVPAFFGGAFNIFLLRQFFMTIPTDLEDAAKIDGCSYLGIYWRIMLPLVKPALATITIFAFMGAWNNFMGPLIYVSSPEQMPLAYALQLFQSSHGSEYGLQMAASTLVVLPVLAVFFFTQRYFIQGITLTGIKG